MVDETDYVMRKNIKIRNNYLLRPLILCSLFFFRLAEYLNETSTSRKVFCTKSIRTDQIIVGNELGLTRTSRQLQGAEITQN